MLHVERRDEELGGRERAPDHSQHRHPRPDQALFRVGLRGHFHGGIFLVVEGVFDEKLGIYAKHRNTETETQQVC